MKSAEEAQVHAALAQVEDAFSQELNILGASGSWLNFKQLEVGGAVGKYDESWIF